MKQRIMGLIILVAIALIFVPILFSRSGSSAPSNQQAKNTAPTLATAQSTMVQSPVSAPSAPQQSPQATNTPDTATAPDQIVFQSPDQATQQPQAAPSATTAENNTPTASATPPTSIDNEAQNEQLVPAANPTVPTEEPTAIAQPQVTDQPNAAPSAATATNTANNIPTANPAMAATAPPAPTNNMNPVQPVQNEQQPVPVNPTVLTEQTPNVAPSNTATATPNDMNSEVTPVTPQPPTANNQAEITAPQPDKGIAASESDVLQGAQQQFQHSPRQKSASAHAATHHEKQRQPTHIAQLQEKKSATKEHGWIIQLGSFAEQKNVEKLIQQLHAQGFAAHVKPIHTSHGTITRVYLGPEIQRERANQIAKQINEHLAIHSIVVPA